jgi:hypothetical protein
MKMRYGFLPIQVLLLMSVYAFSQANDVKDLESLRQSIEKGTLEAKYKISLKLECQGQTTLTYVSLIKGRHHAALQSFGDDCAYRQIVFFESQGEKWIQVADLRLSTHYGEQPEVKFLELTEPGVQDLMVQHQVVDWGTGVEQKNMTLYKWISDHFEVTFDEPEVVHLSAPITDKRGVQSYYQIEQQSTFDVAPSEVQGVKKLVEHLSVKRKRLVLSRVRTWIWDHELRRFRSFETAP